VIAIVVAPLVDQLRLLLAPELIVVGAAENELMAGSELFPEDAGEEPQATSAADARRTRASARGECLRLRNPLISANLPPNRFEQCIDTPCGVGCRSA
jgi:hypothetical protein